MVTKSKVDPDTGLTAQQQKDFFKNRPTAEDLGFYDKSPKDKAAKPKAARKLARKSDATVGTNDLKTQAVNLYGQGLSAKDVAKTLSITYANAYYYKRFVGADVAKARLDQALARV
jgi:hypothetical protein